MTTTTTTTMANVTNKQTKQSHSSFRIYLTSYQRNIKQPIDCRWFTHENFTLIRVLSVCLSLPLLLPLRPLLCIFFFKFKYTVFILYIYIWYFFSFTFFGICLKWRSALCSVQTDPTNERTKWTNKQTSQNKEKSSGNQDYIIKWIYLLLKYAFQSINVSFPPFFIFVYFGSKGRHE